MTLSEVSFLVIDLCANSSTGTLHTFFVVAAFCVVGSYITSGQVQPRMFFAGIRRLLWDAGSFSFDVLTQWCIALKLSMKSQIGELWSSRQGGICHYCLPTGFEFKASNDDKFDDAIAFAHRCSRCVLRHWTVGDRPMYKAERYHHKLLHRSQHVICSDRQTAKGMLANINLTRSNLVDDPALDRQYSYQTYLAHAVRAELITLGGSITFVSDSPGGQGVTAPRGDPSSSASSSDAPATGSGPAGNIKAAESSATAAASRLIEPGAPLVPYTSAPPGIPMEHVRVIVDWDKVDLRKDLGMKTEALAVLDAESKVRIIDDDLLATHGVTPKARVSMPGVTDLDLMNVHVACNTHDNALAGIGNRHYAKKYAEVSYEGVEFKNQVGNPYEIIRRPLHAMVETITPVLLDIDESEIKRVDSKSMDIPMSEVVSELHGKTLFPLHKMISEIAPNSFTEKLIEENFDAVSGTCLPKAPVTKAFVKPNETLNKIKPRLAQHAGPQGSAMSALMNKTIEECIFRLPYFVIRSIKGTDHHGVSERILSFYQDYSSGGFASTDWEL